MESKYPRDTYNITSEIVLPNDTNTLGNLMGGRLMHMMDISAAISAMRHCNRPVVTASVDNVSFSKPIQLGNLVTIESRVSRSFNTSMEVFLRVWGENLQTKEKFITNEAYFTFVALDDNRKPIQVAPIVPETDEEIKMFDGALRRRQLRLILGGKMKPDEAGELRSLFVH